VKFKKNWITTDISVHAQKLLLHHCLYNAQVFFSPHRTYYVRRCGLLLPTE